MDDSAVRQSLLHQYRGGLDMLGEAVASCPEEIWFSATSRNRFWHVAYHAVFYTHLYVQRSERDFHPWPLHRDNSNYLGPRPWARDQPFEIPEPYTQPEVQDYLQLCRGEVERQIPLECFEEPSGFSWLPFNRFEVHLYNIRHLQHHTGQLVDRLRNVANLGVAWKGVR